LSSVSPSEAARAYAARLNLPSGPEPATIHATTVAHSGRALVIVGAAGSGKSSLAIQLVAMGAKLVADDRTRLHPGPRAPLADCPPSITGLIEARQVGLLRLPRADPTPVAVIVDLDHLELDRLPHRSNVFVMGHEVPLLRRAEGPHFPSALLLILAHGLAAP